MMRLLIAAAAGLVLGGAPSIAQDLIEIRPGVSSIVIDTEGGWTEITRERTPEMMIAGPLQPARPVEGVHPVGELEIIDALDDDQAVVVDMRTDDWRNAYTIPGSKHIPYDEVADRLDELGCTGGAGAWDCSDAMKVYAFCNGPNCGQSPTAMRNMAEAGFPADRIYYYRGGMQSWVNNGLTVVNAEGEVVAVKDWKAQ